MNWGFLAFLFSVGTFILELPDLAEKFGKSIPLLLAMDSALQRVVRTVAMKLPPAPDDYGWIDIFSFWPNLVTIAVGTILLVLFAYINNVAIGRREWLADRWIQTSVVGMCLALYMSQAWLLHRSSNLTLIESFKMFSYLDKYEAALDKTFFIHATNIYGLSIYAFSILVYCLIFGLWKLYLTIGKEGKN